MKGYFLEGDTIVINRGLTELDIFVRDFLDVIKKHCDYLIVSGFVSISTGRTRGTEDVDILIEKTSKEKFKDILADLQEKGFWCYQGDSVDSLYCYVEDMNNIRFARNEEIFPNMEVVFIDESKRAKYYEFNHPQKIRAGNFNFKIPPLEFEILYKELVLAGKKDLEDAKHLRVFFNDILDDGKFEECRKIILEDKSWQ
jgi:hypothetical protein